MKYWLPLGLYCSLIFFQATLPIPMKEIHYVDKLIHFIVYAVLGVLIFRAIRSLPGDAGLFVIILIALTISSIVGFCDEIIQIFTPTRTLDRVDFCFDVFGSLSGMAAYILIKSRKKKMDKLFADSTKDTRGDTP